MAKKTTKTTATAKTAKPARDTKAIAESLRLVRQALGALPTGDNFEKSLASVAERMDKVVTADQRKATKATDRAKAKLEKVIDAARAQGIDVSALLQQMEDKRR